MGLFSSLKKKKKNQQKCQSFHFPPNTKNLTKGKDVSYELSDIKNHRILWTYWLNQVAESRLHSAMKILSFSQILTEMKILQLSDLCVYLSYSRIFLAQKMVNIGID